MGSQQPHQAYCASSACHTPQKAILVVAAADQPAVLCAEGAVHGTHGSVAGAGREHGGGGIVAAQGAVGVRAPEAPQAAQAAVAADQQAGAGRASARQPNPGIAGACSACKAVRR